MKSWITEGHCDILEEAIWNINALFFFFQPSSIVFCFQSPCAFFVSDSLLLRFRPISVFREANEDESGFTCCAFSARERFLMLGTCTGQLKLYNVFSGQEEASYNCHNSAITHLEPSRVRVPRLFSIIFLRWVGELSACGLALYINLYPCSSVCVWSVAASVLQWQSWVVVTQTIWLTKPDVFTVWPFK